MESSKDPRGARVSACPICPKSGATTGSAPAPPSKPKPNPRQGRGQGAEMVQFDAPVVRIVEIWGQFQYARPVGPGSRRPSLLEVRFGWNHLLMEDAHDQQLAGLNEVKHNVLANLKAT